MRLLRHRTFWIHALNTIHSQTRESFEIDIYNRYYQPNEIITLIHLYILLMELNVKKLNIVWNNCIIWSYFSIFIEQQGPSSFGGAFCVSPRNDCSRWLPPGQRAKIRICPNQMQRSSLRLWKPQSKECFCLLGNISGSTSRLNQGKGIRLGH